MGCRNWRPLHTRHINASTPTGAPSGPAGRRGGLPAGHPLRPGVPAVPAPGGAGEEARGGEDEGCSAAPLADGAPGQGPLSADGTRADGALPALPAPACHSQTVAAQAHVRAVRCARGVQVHRLRQGALLQQRMWVRCGCAGGPPPHMPVSVRALCDAARIKWCTHLPLAQARTALAVAACPVSRSHAHARIARNAGQRKHWKVHRGGCRRLVEALGVLPADGEG